jgi:hypothetical protein
MEEPEAIIMITKWIVSALAVALPLSTLAQSDDVAYCRALTAKYQKYLVKTEGGHVTQKGSLDGSVAAEHCKAGDTSGIPVLERKLRAAGVELPPRG